jgi:hypothetical protein
MNNLHLILVIAVLFCITNSAKIAEHFGTGALVQLYAKGPQDTYHTKDAYNHMWWNPYRNYYREPGHTEMVWNNPTRYNPMYRRLGYYSDYYPQYDYMIPPRAPYM